MRRVPCGPLGDWFSALRLSTIDFFSLDVEGAELVVLQTLPLTLTLTLTLTPDHDPSLTLTPRTVTPNPDHDP